MGAAEAVEPEEATVYRQRWTGSALRGGMRGLATVSPQLAAGLLEVLFRRVRRHPVPAREAQWLAGAERDDVELAGARLPLWTWGEGPAVLLVHGWEGRGSQMAAFAEPLVATGYRAVAYDAPGHGESAGRLSSLPAMAAAVDTVAAACGPLHGLVAHSAGAAATAVAMRRGLAVPRAVFVAPAADPGRFLGVAAGWLGLPRPVAELAQRRIERRFGFRFSDLKTAELAPNLDGRLLVLHDRGDREVPWSEGAEIARRWPGARLRSTHELGHRRILRDEAVVEEAVEFLTA